MEFEEMQIVWDEQKKQRMYALDLEALHASVRRKGRRIARGVEAMEIGMVTISTSMAAFFVVKGLRESSDHHEFFAAAVLLAVAVYLVAGRVRRRRRERSFASNLRGDLDRAIAQVDYHIRRIRTMPLWFFAPALLTVLVNLLFGHSSKPAWVWLAVLVAFPFGIYVARLELKCSHLATKRELEALRAKLTDEH